MQVLEKYFDTAFDAPDGIKKLRELILTLAMQGKLVPQDPNDQPASELLKEIEKEKEQLIKDGKIKKSKPSTPIKDSEIPFNIPNNWKWCRVGELLDSFIGGYAYNSSEFIEQSDNQVLRLGNIRPSFLRVEANPVFINDNLANSTLNFKLSINDILITMTGTRGKKDYCYTVLIEEKDLKDRNLFLNQRVGCFRFNQNIYASFFNLALKNDILLDSIYKTATGSANQANIGSTALNNWIVPLPPLNEQKRIVEKINQLMALCDELEKLKVQKEAKKLTVHKSAINQLLDSKDESNSQKGWNFISNHFNDLYTVKENVSELRSTILQLAMQGKLVPQDPNDQPASELLKEIEKEKQRLIKDGKIKKSKPLEEIQQNEMPFILPNKWAFVRLIEIGTWALGSGLPLAIQGEKDLEILLCKVSDMNLDGNEKYIITSNHSVSQKVADESKLNICEPDTIIFPKIGGAIATNKRRIIIKPTVIDNNCLGIKPFSLIDLEWAYQLLQFFDFSKYQSGTSVPAISQGVIGSIVIGLPPKNEQKRIVEKINQLMVLCDDLEKQIENSSSKQTQLLNAIMSNLGK